MRLRVKNALLHKLGFVQPSNFYTPWTALREAVQATKIILNVYVFINID